MTKVQLHYDLEKPITDDDAESIAHVHGVYGIARVTVAPSLDKITVDYDASRLSEREVEAALIRNGIRIKRDPVPAA